MSADFGAAPTTAQAWQSYRYLADNAIDIVFEADLDTAIAARRLRKDIAEVFGLIERPVLSHKAWRGNRHHVVFHDAQMLHIGVAPGAKTHRQVGVFGHHVQQRNAHLQREVYSVQVPPFF